MNNKIIISVIVIFFFILLIILLCKKNVKVFSKKYRLQDSFGTPTNNQLIPQVVYQTVKDKNNVPKEIFDYAETMKKLNPEYSFQYFDDDDQRNFIRNNFDDRTLGAYDKLKPKAFKADLWRYCILYVRGGVYIDAGTDVKKPFREFIAEGDEFVSVKDLELTAGDTGIYQAFIASVSKHPFLDQIIKDCIENVENNFIGESPLEITGPVALGYSINKVLGRSKTEGFSVGENNFGIYRFVLLYNKWMGRVVDANDVEVFYKHYPLLKIFTIGGNGQHHYSLLWRLAKKFEDPDHLYK